MGNCETFKNCTDDSDCNSDLNGVCDNSVCYEDAWCPMVQEESEVFYLNPAMFKISLKSAVEFPETDTTITYTDVNTLSTKEYPKAGATIFTIADILNLLPKYSKIPYEDLKDVGAIIRSNLKRLTSDSDGHLGLHCGLGVQSKFALAEVRRG